MASISTRPTRPGRRARSGCKPRPASSSSATFASRPNEQRSVEQEEVHVREAQVSVGRLGGGVFAFYIEPQFYHVALAPGLFHGEIEQGTEHALLPSVGSHVHALKPPDPAVAPVAPFVRNHQLADHGTLVIGDEVSTPIDVSQHG